MRASVFFEPAGKQETKRREIRTSAASRGGREVVRVREEGGDRSVAARPTGCSIKGTVFFEVFVWVCQRIRLGPTSSDPPFPLQELQAKRSHGRELVQEFSLCVFQGKRV